MIDFGNIPRIQISWTNFKNIVTSKILSIQYDLDSTSVYNIFAFDGHFIIYYCTIYVIDPTGVPGYDSVANAVDKADFETNYKSKSNKSLVSKTSDGRALNAVGKGDVSKANFYTHDWSDPTTWYENSVRVVDETATDDGYHTTYSVTHVNMIDSYHGKITQEDFIKNKEGYSYRIIIKINDVVKTEQNPHYLGVGGDFIVDYSLGKITFLSTLDPEDVVKVTYCYATNSIFTIKPAAGKMLRVDIAEVQFSSDVEVTDTIIFQPYGFVEYFAPQYLQSNGGPYPPGTKIPLGNPVVYKSMTDYQAEAIRAYPVYPAIGGNSWRGCPYSILIMNWDYISSTVLKSSMGMEIRLRLEHDKPFDGWYATATFYCNSSDE